MEDLITSGYLLVTFILSPEEMTRLRNNKRIH
jgi:hypothetical protein